MSSHVANLEILGKQCPRNPNSTFKQEKDFSVTFACLANLINQGQSLLFSAKFQIG